MIYITDFIAGILMIAGVSIGIAEGNYLSTALLILAIALYTLSESKAETQNSTKEKSNV